MTKEKEVKDRIDAYVEETWRCWIDQEASMKESDLKCMFEQISILDIFLFAFDAN